MTTWRASASSADYFRTPRRGFIQDGMFTQYPQEFGGPARGESDAEFESRLKAFDAGIQRLEPKGPEDQPPQSSQGK